MCGQLWKRKLFTNCSEAWNLNKVGGQGRQNQLLRNAPAPACMHTGVKRTVWKMVSTIMALNMEKTIESCSTLIYHVCSYVCTYMCVCLCVCICMYTSMCILLVCMHVYVIMCMYACVHVCVCLCVCTCVLDMLVRAYGCMITYLCVIVCVMCVGTHMCVLKCVYASVCV